MNPLKELLHVIVKSIPVFGVIVLHHLLWNWALNYFNVWYITVQYIDTFLVNFLDIIIIYYYWKLLKVLGLHK